MQEQTQLPDAERPELNERTLLIKGEGMARGQTVVIKEIPMNKIKLGRNCRLATENADLSGLMQSINSVGLLEPIGVVESKDGKSYEIAYGNRRYMAFSRLGLHSITAVIRKRRNDTDIDVQNLAENVQRRNISMQEIGRYAKILAGEGLNKKELAVRLGTSVNYIETALSAYDDIPKKFRHDLEPTWQGKKTQPGKINVTDAKAIISAAKTYNVGEKFRDALFTAAKDDDRFAKENIPKYIAAAKKGHKDPIGSVEPIKTLTFRFLMLESDYDKLVADHIEGGPFNSIYGLAKAILKGKKSVKMNLID